MEFTRGSQQGEDNKIVFDLKKRIVFLFCKIDVTAALEICSLLDELRSKEKKNNKILTVIINSRGGEALQGLAIFDFFRTSGFKIRTILAGEISSSAIAVALAGHERWMHKHAVMGFHRTNFEFDNPQKILEPHRVDIERGQIEVIDRYYAEILIANSNLTLEQIRAMEQNEEFVTAVRAKELGLIHKIID